MRCPDGLPAKAAGRAEVADAPPLASHTPPHQSLLPLAVRAATPASLRLGRGREAASRQGRKKCTPQQLHRKVHTKWMAPLAF